MWVTCYADASYSKRKGGGWAVWLRSDEGRVVRDGRCPSYVKSSIHAELAAIYAGLFLSVCTWGRRVEGITINSDSQVALDLLDCEAPLSADPSARRLQERIRSLVRNRAIEIEARWVKAHRGPEVGTAAYLNHQCDRRARKARARNTPS